ncbi:MAG: Cro/CI family transcriptional regulator [Dichotomicrobium sp.]
MDKQITKREAREIMGVESDHALAKKLGTSHQAVYKWGGDDEPIPEKRQWQIRCLIAEGKVSRPGEGSQAA